MSYVAEKFFTIALRKICTDSDLILAYDVHHVIDRLYNIVECSFRASFQERRKHRNADEAASIGYSTKLRIGFVARMRFKRGW